MDDYLSLDRIEKQGIFNVHYVEDIKKRFFSGKKDYIIINLAQIPVRIPNQNNFEYFLRE